MQPDSIVLHCSATRDSGTVSWAAIRRYHTETLGWRDIGYHFGIELVGESYEILTGRMLNERGAHCRAKGMNRHSLGICIVGDFDRYPVPNDQWDLTLRLVAGLVATTKITVDKIYGHREFTDKKSCPGTLVSLDKFREGVELLS